MAARTRKRPVRKIGRKMKTKLFALFMLIVVAMLGLIGRLMFIEYTSGDAYTKKVLSLQSYDSKTIPFQRGNIVDSNGTVITRKPILPSEKELEENSRSKSAKLRVFEKNDL